MTRSSSEFLLHRASERVSAGAAAVALTFLTLLTVDARATEPAGNPPSITVSYSDVAFGNTAGAADVYRKLKVAARKVCGLDRVTVLPLAMQYELQVCANEATARAVNDVNAPLLTRRQIIVSNID